MGGGGKIKWSQVLKGTPYDIDTLHKIKQRKMYIYQPTTITPGNRCSSTPPRADTYSCSDLISQTQNYILVTQKYFLYPYVRSWEYSYFVFSTRYEVHLNILVPSPYKIQWAKGGRRATVRLHAIETLEAKQAPILAHRRINDMLRPPSTKRKLSGSP